MDDSPPYEAEQRHLTPGAKLDPAVDIALAVIATLLLVLYVTVAIRRDFFAIPTFDYHLDKPTFMMYFHPAQLSSMFWKVSLLFPASAALAVLLTRAGVRVKIWEPAGSVTRMLIPVTILAAIVLIVITAVLQRTEVTDDEIVYTFQAKTLLEGRVTNPPPPSRENFGNVFMINDGRQWIGHYNAGYPLILAIGLLLGSPYAATVLAAILTLVLIYNIGLLLFQNSRIAFLAACLMVVSPLFTLTAATLLSHTVSSMVLSLFIYCALRVDIARARPGATLLPGLVAGLALGYGFNMRPLTAMAFALPFVVLGIARIRERGIGGATRYAGIVAGFAVVFGLTLVYNNVITGDPLLFPIPYLDAGERIGFGTQGHTPFTALSNLAVNVVKLNAFAFGFPVSLIFVLTAMFRKAEFGDRLCFGLLASHFVAYLFWWSPGVSDLGPIYYSELMVPIALLSSRTVFWLSDVTAQRWPSLRYLVFNFLAVSIAMSAIAFYPERLSHLHRLASQIREPYDLVESNGVHDAVVFVSSLPQKGWVFGYRTPSPSLTDDVIYCGFRRRSDNARVVAAFPDRACYVLRYDQRQGRSELTRIGAQDLLSFSPE